MPVARVKIAHFRRKTRYNSKMVGLIPLKTTQIFAFFVAFHIFVLCERKDFKFATQVQGRLQGKKWTQLASNLAQGEEFPPWGKNASTY